MKIFFVPPILFLIDLVLGGPLGFFTLIPIRHVLFVLMILSLWWCAHNNGRRFPDYALLPTFAIVAFLAWNIIWATVVPSVNGVELTQAWSEADAFLLLLTPILFFLAFGDNIKFLRRMAGLMIMLITFLGWAQTLLWLIGTYYPVTQHLIRSKIIEFYGSDAIFVGPMPDGFFRVFWISSLWIIPAIFLVPNVVKNSISTFADEKYL